MTYSSNVWIQQPEIPLPLLDLPNVIKPDRFPIYLCTVAVTLVLELYCTPSTRSTIQYEFYNVRI